MDRSELAVAASADVLVAQGTEAGGHTGTMSPLVFVAGVVDGCPDVPLLAVGGSRSPTEALFRRIIVNVSG